jgi:hypothetical protein
MTNEDLPVQPDLTVVLAQAGHHRDATTERRTVGLKIVVGIVGFDLAVTKLAIDAASHVKNIQELAWSLRGIAVVALVVVTGMLCQIELRSRHDRQIYVGAERRAEAIQAGCDPGAINQPIDSLPKTFANAWATTWPLLGIAALTAAMCVLAGSLR